MLSIDTIRQFVRTHPGKTILVAIAAVLYIGFNVWVYFFTTSGGFKTNPAAIIILAPTPTPTPTPKTGPGPHGCDPYGVCNLYSPQMLKENCTVTFADPECLGACTDRAKRCKK